MSIVFYLQHQFENTYWISSDNWTNEDASLHGSSFLIFGPFMKKITCNIGFHHIHHLNPLIPCYNLSKAHDHVKNFITFKIITVLSHERLWDNKLHKLVDFLFFLYFYNMKSIVLALCKFV